MGGKNFVQSFSYNLKDAEIIDECIRIARQDGVSFSEFVVSLLKEESKRKKAVGDQTPINISYGIHKEKPLQLDLDGWLGHVGQVQEQVELNKLKGQFARVCHVIDRRSMDLRMNRRIG